jgi:hypothetical protein
MWAGDEPAGSYHTMIGNRRMLRYQDFSGESRARSRAAALHTGSLPTHPRLRPRLRRRHPPASPAPPRIDECSPRSDPHAPTPGPAATIIGCCPHRSLGITSASSTPGGLVPRRPGATPPSGTTRPAISHGRTLPAHASPTDSHGQPGRRPGQCSPGGPRCAQGCQPDRGRARWNQRCCSMSRTRRTFSGTTAWTWRACGVPILGCAG